jgi:hypothetical protein
MLKTSAALRTQETWLPVCLPKFNPDGFVYTFISYVRPEIGLVFLSADREGFVELREWKEAVLTVCLSPNHEDVPAYWALNDGSFVAEIGERESAFSDPRCCPDARILCLCVWPRLPYNTMLRPLLPMLQPILASLDFGISSTSHERMCRSRLPDGRLLTQRMGLIEGGGCHHVVV